MQIPIRPPLRGLNTVNPYLPIDSGFARELTNVSIANGKLPARPACRIELSPTRSDDLHYYNKSGSDWYGIYRASGEIRKLDDNTGSGTVGGACHENPEIVKHISLELLFGAREPRSNAAPSFTAWTFTTLGITETDIRHGVSHKGRLYVSDTSTIEYSTLGAITGTMDGSFSVSNFMDGQPIFKLFSMSVKSGDETQNVFVVVGKQGRVLVYQGSFPGDSTWGLVGKFDMPQCASESGFVEIDGDVFVVSHQYCYWLRDLFVGGAQTAYQNSPSQAIENLIQAVDWDSDHTSAEYSHAFYYEPLDAIVVQCSEKNTTAAALGSITDYTNEACYFAYFRKYRAWSLWTMAPFFAPVVEISDTYYAKDYSGRLKKLVPGNMRDQDADSVEIDIEGTWKTPYIFPYKGKNHKMTHIRPYWENSLTGFFEKIRAIFDYSDLNSPWGFYTQSMVTAVNPGNYGEGQIDEDAVSWDQYHHRASIDGIGAGVSFQFTIKPKASSADAQVQEIYAATAYLEEGGVNI